MSAWNFSAENIHVATPMVMVAAVKIDAVPRCFSASTNASFSFRPLVLHLVLHALEQIDAVVDADADAERYHRQRVHLHADAEHRHQRVAEHRDQCERQDDAQVIGNERNVIRHSNDARTRTARDSPTCPPPPPPRWSPP